MASLGVVPIISCTTPTRAHDPMAKVVISEAGELVVATSAGEIVLLLDIAAWLDLALLATEAASVLAVMPGRTAAALAAAA